MCGITGIISTNGKPLSAPEKQLEKMNDAIAHRGPDADGRWMSSGKKAILGHRRLSIVDLSDAGRQPMGTPDGKLQIVFNGEIYNHKEIRAKLEKKGYHYHSATDSESILYAYQEWGEKCLEMLRGMFVIVIYDENKHTLFFARDRIGIKPLYYTFCDGAFYFASEIKAILALPHIPRQIDATALHHYLSVFAVPAPRTMFAGISKLPAAHCGTLEDGRLHLRQYWDLPLTTDTRTTEGEWIDEIRTTLHESVRLRMMSDVPFGAYLSGGIDSTTLGVLMHNEIDRPLDTFTVGFKRNEDLNETQFAREVSESEGFNYHEVLVDRPELDALLKKLAWQTDEPNGDWVCFPLYYVSQLIHEHKVVVAQVGEGSDELFCGYSGYLLWLNVDKATRWLRWLPQSVLNTGYTLASKYRHHSRARFVMNVFYHLKERQELFLGGAVAFTEPEKRHILQDVFLAKAGYADTYDVMRPHLEKAKAAGADRLQQMTYIEFKHRLPEILLMRVDKMSMAHSIEARVPFLDHKFVERMFTIPTAMKLRHKRTKHLLKEAVRGLIPDEVIERKKLGFLAPIADWLNDPKFMTKMKQIVMRSKLLDEPIFRRERVEELFENYSFRRNGHRATQIWLLVQLALWYDTWLTEPTSA